MPNNPDLEALLELHRLDTKIERLANQRNLLPLTLRRIEARLEQHRQSLGEKENQLKEIRTRTHTLEVELKTAEDEIQKLSAQLLKASSNKEYAAFQHEIEAKKADCSRIEDQVLAAMTDADHLDGELRQLRDAIAQIEREHQSEAAGIEEDAAKLDAEIAQLRQQRGQAVEKVSAELLEEYERIASKKGSSALAPVVGNACQGCFMQLPPQLDHALRGGRSIVRCPNCSRILYLP